MLPNFARLMNKSIFYSNYGITITASFGNSHLRAVLGGKLSLKMTFRGLSTLFTFLFPLRSALEKVSIWRLLSFEYFELKGSFKHLIENLMAKLAPSLFGFQLLSSLSSCLLI